MVGGIGGTVALSFADPMARGAVAQPMIVLGIVTAWLRVRKMAQPHRRAWTLFTAGGTLIFVGGVARLVHGTIIGVEQPIPSPADVLYVAGYLAFILGAIELLRRRSDAVRDWDSWLDALIVTAAAAVTIWVFFLEQYVGDPATPSANGRRTSSTRS